MALLKIIGYKIRCTWKNYLRKKTLKRIKQEIITYYSKYPSNNNEITAAVDYLRQHPLNTFLAPFTQKYNYSQVVVHKDSSNGLLYVIHENKKLFFKRSYNKFTVQYCYSGLITEQDENSPHCYIDNKFKVEDNEVLFDIGSAEGIFPLSMIEKTSRVVLFERDKEWAEALEATFEPWKEKVTIITKYVSDKNDLDNISIDSFLNNYSHRPDFIKIDVEGAEMSVINGMKNLIDAKSLKLALCTYHQTEDYELFNHLLSKQGFKLTSSKGVMIFLNDISHLKPPYLRKGVIRAQTIRENQKEKK